MDSWTLQGDSYSFLRSAPRTFSLCHRDGTPNHVEIFDIINVPAQRSAISETTCLCDIFGDDRESPSLSSSPSAGAFVSSQRVEEGTTAASPQLDELNDSSGSYHTAQGSSEGEEGFEESKEGFYSPILQNDSSDGRHLEDKELSSQCPQVSEKGSSDLEQKGVTPVPHLRTGTPSSQDLNGSKSTPSPECYSPSPLHPEGRLSSLSSSSSEHRLLSSSPNLKQSYSETELRRITPSFKNRQSSSSTQSLTPSPSLPEYLFEPKAIDFDKTSSPSPQFTHLSQDFTDSDLEFKTVISSPLPSTSGLESKSHLGTVLVSPSFGNSSPSPYIQGSSPLSELSGRVSLPDLFSRGSTPDKGFAQDFAQSTERISDSSTGEKDTATTPESPETGLSAEPGSSVSTPGPCYTPPPSAVSVLTTPELVGDTVKPELKNTRTSPSLLSPASPNNTGSRSPSPEPSPNRQNSLTFSEIGTQVSSHVVSLSTSPAVEQNSSLIEDKYTSPSPEIRITASSPEIKRKDEFSPEKTGSESPLLDPHFGSTSPRSLTSSPHFTGISYSVVEPEERTSPPFPELQGQRTLMSSGIVKKSTNNSVVESTGTPQHSTSSSVSLPEAPLLPQSRNQTPSPQPNPFTPSPEPRYQITTFDKLPSPSSQHGSRDPSPEASFSEQRYQQSPAALSTEYNPLYTKPTSLRSTPEIKADSIIANTTETQSPTHLEKNSVPPLFDLYRREKEAVVELPNNSPVEAVHSPTSELSDTFSDSPLIQQTTEREETIKEACIWDRLSVVSSSEEKQDNHSSLFQEEIIKFDPPNLRSPEDRNQDIHPPFFEDDVKSAAPNLTAFLERNQNIHSPFFEKEAIKSASPNPRAPEDRNQDTHSSSFEKELKPASPNPRAPEVSNSNISPVHGVILNSPVQNLHPEFTSPSFNFNNNVYSPKWVGTPESPKRQLLTKVKCEDKARLTQDMSHHRRQTPSPPLIRFTPVHIIAPEKPYRQWQRRSPSQSLASKPSSNLKKEVTNRESSNVDLADTTSQAHWIQLRKQMEMDRKMSLEQERDLGMDRGMNREIEEEHAPEREVGWQRAASYRGEQVELSFSARNRKGPASHTAGPTSRETSQGLPTAHSYPESLLMTRQLQQQQILPKLPSQQDTLGGSTSRKLQPASQDRKRAPRRLATNRPCQSSSSSMGSELDEADNEVKWLTDVAFRRLSSPEIDYLDMYNSSHCSSANISQPSTQESPAGVNTAWMAYADFRGSAPKIDNDELFFNQPSTQYSDGLDSSRRYELGSFECIDVAVEREDCRRVRRGVPKRQIQLKRKNIVEGKQDESSENSSPGVPAMVESPCQEGHSRGTFMRQHSTPAAMQECHPSDGSAELNQQKIRQSKFQKSASMDETYSKTKMASCLIKNVLSKKMQSTDLQPDEQANEEASLSSGSVAAPLKESPKPESRDLSSSLQSDCSLSSEGVSVRGESSTNEQTKLPKSHGVRSNTRPSSSSSGRSVTFSLTDIGEDVCQRRSAKLSESEVKSELNLEFECGSELTHGREASDSVNTTAWDTGASSASEATDTQARVTNRDQECENTEPLKQVLHGDKGASRTQEITVKAVGKKKASLNVCLTPEIEKKPFSSDVSNRKNEEKAETHVEEKTEDEGHEDNPTKAPMHKVRDVRRLVKNTYSLSFKAATAVHSSNVNEEKMENSNEERREEVSAAEEKDVTQEIKMEDKREKEKRIWMEKNKEQKEAEKDPNLLILPQNKGSSLSGPQMIQIEYKAVCWKDDKNKRSSIRSDLSDEPQESFKYLSKEFEELQSSNPDTANQPTENKEVHKLCEHDFNITEEMLKNISETYKEPVSEENPVMTRTDQKPPMLGSLPKLPSKEREVSTAVVLIREKQNKNNVLVSSNQEETPPSIQASVPASLSPGPFTPGNTSGTGGHSVSMLLKEKGYQADIGAVVADNQSSAGPIGVPPKHVNSLKIPLQSIPPSDGSLLKSHREKTSSSSTTSAVTDNPNLVTNSKEDEEVIVKPQDTAKQKITSLEQIPSPAKQKDTGDFEAVKRIDPTFPPRSPAIRRFKPKPVEVQLSSKESPKQETLTNSTGNNRPQTIEVRSIAKNSQKPAVPPKPNCKFRPADLGNLLNDTQRTSAMSSSSGKPQVEERPQTIVVSSPTIYRKISNESMATSNYSKKLTVSAVSSLKPPPHRPTATTISTPTNQPKTSSDTEASTDRVQHRQSTASPQSPRNAPKTASLTRTPAASLDVTSDSSSDPKPNQIPGVLPSEASQSAATDSDSPLQYPKATCHREQAQPGTFNTNQLTGVSTMQEQSCTHQPCGRSVSSEHARRLDNLHFFASDDPPSYDERESFSPLLLPDLTPPRSNRYQSSSRPPPCPCTAGIPSHSGHTSPHHHRSPHNFTPPGPTHSSYQVSQPPQHPLQYRHDPQPLSYQPGSPKSSPLGPNQPMYQPLHQSAPCPPHPSLMQACPADRSVQPPQHIGSRRPPVHRSPHQQPPNIAGAPYSDPGHSHSPGLAPIDPQYMCGPQTMGSSYGSEYGGDSSSLYSESSFGQMPRRVLLDPETGKYFFIDLPVQPLRKMLFDPETGQYVEVLIPQQAMSHSGLYPPSAAPFPPLHNPNMYSPAPQYMPCAAPPPLAHPQAQPPQYPEASAAATMHPSRPGVGYRNPSCQGSKPDLPNHPPLDHSYLENRYYVPTGINASPNPTPPDYYHKHAPNMPTTGGNRS